MPFRPCSQVKFPTGSTVGIRIEGDADPIDPYCRIAVEGGGEITSIRGSLE